MDDVDVLVVGAGILGMASAYHILKGERRRKVLVVDRYGAPGQGNTGRSNAMFRNTFSSKDNQTLANASIDFYLHVQDEMKVDIGLQQIGYLWLMSERQHSAARPLLEGMNRNGVETQTLDSRELLRRLPSMVTDFGKDEQASMMGLPRVEAGVFGPKCGRLDPDKLVRFYAGEFLRMGGRFAFGTEALQLLVGPEKPLGLDGEPFVWQDSEIKGVRLAGKHSGTIRAETVVLACGAWGNELLGPIGLDGHVRAKKRQIFSISTEGGSALRALIHVEGFNSLRLLPLVILPKSGVHFKPVSEESALWVACEDEVNRPFLDTPEHDLDRYQAEPEYFERSVKPVLSAYFPAFANARVKAMWAGLYSYNTIDHLPFAFREGNLIVVGGDSGSGIMKGDSLGRIVEAIYSGRDEAFLCGNVSYKASKLGFERRDVEREEWVI